MTLENAQRLLKHFNDLADGTITQPFGHKNWADVVANAKIRAGEMQKRVNWYNSEGFRVKHNLPEVVKEEDDEKNPAMVKKETKSKGKK